jgi:hypothetical protein
MRDKLLFCKRAVKQVHVCTKRTTSSMQEHKITRASNHTAVMIGCRVLCTPLCANKWCSKQGCSNHRRVLCYD